ncbi:hypothetical protein AAFP94_14730 [Flavobacteriaceae bacterium MJ-SS4]|uniref:hypothetical protein n=1 Tax=Gilvirhabdus luticola TaxID=3079858 RepID=UPI0032DC9BF5
MKKCLNCGKVLEGRSDKIYCDVHCKSSYQYQQTKIKGASFYQKVDKQLKHNRKLLKNYNKAGKATIRASALHKEGFDPNFFTHYWKNLKGDVYLFVYEYGFLKRKENNIEKYVLILWQDYMNN